MNSRLCFMFFVAAAFPAFAGSFLARNGATGYSIVRPDAEPDETQYALRPSHELKIHLDRMTGAEFPIIKESEFVGATPAIYVGNTEFARSHGFDFTNMAAEAWAYETIGDNMVLAGGTCNGTQYAVSEFLERELGCHWFTFESAYIPQTANLKLKKWKRSGKPAFDFRGIRTNLDWLNRQLSGDFDREAHAFVKRNRGNHNDPPQRISSRMGFGHTFYRYVSWEKYFSSHPEYFTMNEKGERIHGPTMQSGGQLCMSNPEVGRVILEQLLATIQADRREYPKKDWPVVYNIGQNDATLYLCKCPSCMEISTREGSDAAVQLLCLNGVAREIAKEYPDIIIQTFAYCSTEIAPKTVRPEPNILIRWCDLYTYSDCYRPLTSEFNKARREQVQGWQATQAKLAIYDYSNMGILNAPYFRPPRIETTVNAIAPDMRFYRDSGATSYYTEMQTYLHMHPQNFVDLQIWLSYQLANDPDLDEDALIETYMTHHYGPATKPMKRLLKEIRDAIAHCRQPLFYITNPVRPYQTPAFIKRVLGFLREAQKMAPEGTAWRRRIDKELVTPLAVILNSPTLKTDADSPLNREAAAREYEALRKNLIETYSPPEKREEFLKQLAETMSGFNFQAPVPEPFKGVPAERIRIFANPPLSQIEGDADSELSRSQASPRDIPEFHTLLKPGPEGLMASWFGVYDFVTRKSLIFKPAVIPQDEKFHWYNLGRFEFGPNSMVWGWLKTINWTFLDDAASEANGENRTWEVWVSAKFDGPAYVDGSKKENRVRMDRLVLIKPLE